MSIGAATSCEPVTDIAALIARADAALYRAKHDGRNRVHAAEDDTPADRSARQPAAASGPAAKPARPSRAKVPVRRAKSAVPA